MFSNYSLCNKNIVKEEGSRLIPINKTKQVCQDGWEANSDANDALGDASWVERKRRKLLNSDVCQSSGHLKWSRLRDSNRLGDSRRKCQSREGEKSEESHVDGFRNESFGF